MKNSLVLVLSIIAISSSIAQTASIQGKLIDATTKEPLPFASVFLARTSIGANTVDDGSFKIEKIPPGKYELVASILGYARFSKSIEFTDKPIENFTIQLQPISQELAEVTITAHKEKRTAAAYSKFEKIFLGGTSNAYQCKILNKNDVYAYYKNEVLVAYASKPIEVMNNALGYKIIYDLKEFEADFPRNRLTILGDARFEELTASNGKQKSKWIKERDRAYYGSDVHFLHSLITHKLADNFFTIQGADGKFLSEDDLIKDGKIQYKGQVNVNFSKEVPENTMMQRSQGKISGQQSEVIFSGRPIKVYENGYFEDFRDIVFLGHLQLGNVADQVPLGFKPIHSLK